MFLPKALIQTSDYKAQDQLGQTGRPELEDLAKTLLQQGSCPPPLHLPFDVWGGQAVCRIGWLYRRLGRIRTGSASDLLPDLQEGRASLLTAQPIDCLMWQQDFITRLMGVVPQNPGRAPGWQPCPTPNSPGSERQDLQQPMALLHSLWLYPCCPHNNTTTRQLKKLKKIIRTKAWLFLVPAWAYQLARGRKVNKN